MELYYLSNSLPSGILEGYRNSNSSLSKELLPSLTKKISLQHDLLTVNIYVITFETFFKEFINSKNIEIFSRITQNKKL